jgi:hypothetical protein
MASAPGPQAEARSTSMGTLCSQGVMSCMTQRLLLLRHCAVVDSHSYTQYITMPDNYCIFAEPRTVFDL